MTDFVNLKIKLIQFFRYAYMDKICVHVFIEISDFTCMSICNFYICKKNGGLIQR
jgi:hypothetical protein